MVGVISMSEVFESILIVINIMLSIWIAKLAEPSLEYLQWQRGSIVYNHVAYVVINTPFWPVRHNIWREELIFDGRRLSLEHPITAGFIQRRGFSRRIDRSRVRIPTAMSKPKNVNIGISFFSAWHSV